MRIYLASDHAGFELKEKIESFLKEKGFEVEDVGPHQLNPADDYPVDIQPAAFKVSQTPDAKGIIFGGSGQGEAIVANKVKGIRAVVFYGGDPEIIKLSRTHNDSNTLSIGARFVSEIEAQVVVESWLNEPFSGEERHVRRINEIKEIEARQ